MTEHESPDDTPEPEPKPRATKAEMDARIEQVRGMLILNMTKGDIKRKMRTEYGLKHGQTERYLRYARNRNLESIAKSEDEALSESMSYWSKKKQDAEIGLMRASRRLDGYQAKDGRRIEGLVAKEARLLAQIDDSETSDEVREHLVIQLDRVLVAMDDARKSAYSCRMSSMDAQDRIDKVLGNYKPQRFARTTKDGKDVDKPAAAEPETVGKGDDEIERLAEVFRKREGLNTN